MRPAAIRDYWAIAEVHAQSFYPSANWLFAQLLRLDRVFALQVMHSFRHSHNACFNPLMQCLRLDTQVRIASSDGCFTLVRQFVSSCAFLGHIVSGLHDLTTASCNLRIAMGRRWATIMT